jgi:hypothetical protein
MAHYSCLVGQSPHEILRREPPATGSKDSLFMIICVSFDAYSHFMHKWLKTCCSLKLHSPSRKCSYLTWTIVEASGNPSIDRAELPPVKYLLHQSVCFYLFHVDCSYCHYELWDFSCTNPILSQSSHFLDVRSWITSHRPGGEGRSWLYFYLNW